MSVFVMKRGFLLPEFAFRIRNGDGSVPDLASAISVTMTMRRTRDKAVVINAAPVSVIDAADGLVSYKWVAGDTDEIGKFGAEFSVTWPDGRPAPYPGNGLIAVSVTEGAAAP